MDKDQNEGACTPEEKKVVSITEAAKMNQVTRQAIYVAIKMKKLKASKKASRWTIDVSDLTEYRNNKYSRSKSVFDGELTFDPKKGNYSVNQAAEMLQVPTQKIYYATRSGHLKAHRKGAAWVIHVDDINLYREQHLKKKPTQKAG